MTPHSISAPGFRGWKTWGPAFNTIFFVSVGVYHLKTAWGTLPLLDAAITCLLIGLIFHIWWIAIVLKHVEIDGDILQISGLRKNVAVPRSNVIDVKDRSNLKRMPSVIVLKSATEFGTQIRFFPSKPVAEVFAQLKSHLVRRENLREQAASWKGLQPSMRSTLA